MDRSARGFALVFGILCAGIGLLALGAAFVETSSPVWLPWPTRQGRLPGGAISTRPPNYSTTRLPDYSTISLAADPYRYPSGAFTLRYPAGWQIDESEDAAQFTAPDNAGQFSLTFTPTGAGPLPADAYERDLRQMWSDLPAFSTEAIDSTGLPDGWHATFSFDQHSFPDQGPVRMNGLAFYWLRQNVLYTFTALTQAHARVTLIPLFQSVADSVQIYPTAALANSE